MRVERRRMACATVWVARASQPWGSGRSMVGAAPVGVIDVSFQRVAIEAAAADYWYKYVGFDGRVVGMTTFGESAPGGELMKHFGFTTENVVNTALELLD